MCVPVVEPNSTTATSQEELDEEEDEFISDSDPWAVTENNGLDDEVACALPGLINMTESLSESDAVDLSPDWTTVVHNDHLSPESRTVAKSHIPDECSKLSMKQLSDGGVLKNNCKQKSACSLSMDTSLHRPVFICSNGLQDLDVHQTVQEVGDTNVLF